MITKFLLIVWIGISQNQTLSIIKFDTEAECIAAKVALGHTHRQFNGDWVRCAPYTYAE